MAEDKGGSPPTNPDGSGAPASGASGGGNAPAEVPANVKAVIENLGLTAVPVKDWEERERNYQSVKHGKIAGILKNHDALMDADKKRQEAELTELERTSKERDELREQLTTAEVKTRDYALRNGFMVENAKLAADPKAVAVIPAIMDANIGGILSEFEGGDPKEFVQGGLKKLLGIQESLRRELGGASNAPGGGSPASPSGAHSGQPQKREGSVVAQAMDWTRDVAFTTNPHMPPAARGDRKR